jgi:hypothetical protein
VLINVAYLVFVTGLMHRRLLPGELRTWYLDDLLRPIFAGAVVLLLFRFVGPPSGDIAFIVFMIVVLVAVISAAAMAANHVRPVLVAPLRTSLHRS